MVKTISQHIDTLKFHYYTCHELSDDGFHNYIKFVDKMLSLKKEAQTARNDYEDTKSINADIGIHKFNVMSSSISGFSVVILNSDISIAFKKPKSIISASPIIKVEFRAEFLARKGYKKAIEIVNGFISSHILESYKIKISEIHLASDIQGYNFSHLDFFRIKSRARIAQTHEEDVDFSKACAYGSLTSFTGFTFGGGNYHLRVYNKTVEIKKKKEKGFAKVLLWDGKPNYDENKTVWRIEIQIRREKLKSMIDSNLHSLDDYQTILNNIPSLWAKALTDFRFMDLDDMAVFDVLRGKRTLKNGTDKFLTKNAVNKIFQRAEIFKFWVDLKVWNSHMYKDIYTAFQMPKNGSIDYVSNSIKSLFSTMAKHYGSISKETFIKAFADSNRKNVDDKGFSILEGSIVKCLDWFEKIEFCEKHGIRNVPDYKVLEYDIYKTLLDVSDSFYRIELSKDLEYKLLERVS